MIELYFAKSALARWIRSWRTLNFDFALASCFLLVPYDAGKLDVLLNSLAISAMTLRWRVRNFSSASRKFFRICQREQPEGAIP